MARTDYGAILSTVIKDTSDAVREVNGTSSLIAPNQWGTAIRTMHSDSDYDNVMAQLIEETATGDIASFSDGANNIPCPSVLCSINPVQSGSGDPSPSNVRPITGHTELNLVHTGANLWDEEWENGAFDTTTGANIILNTQIRTKDLISVKPNTVYYCKKGGGGLMYCLFYDKNGSVITGYATGSQQSANASEISNTTFTTPPNCAKMKFYCTLSYGATYNHDISINYPSTDTSYHAYTGTTTTTDLGTTVYGGTLDVVSGVLTDKLSDKIDLGSLSYTYENATSTGQSFGVMRATLSPSPKINGDIHCEMFEGVKTGLASLQNNQCCISGTQNYPFLRIRCDEYTDATQFKTFVTGKYISYELATPTTIQLTPQEVKSLLGSNNFYHDCNGQVAVTYRANGQLYVEQHS